MTTSTTLPSSSKDRSTGITLSSQNWCWEKGWELPFLDHLQCVRH
jgi:hypothetical protein